MDGMYPLFRLQSQEEVCGLEHMLDTPQRPQGPRQQSTRIKSTVAFHAFRYVTAARPARADRVPSFLITFPKTTPSTKHLRTSLWISTPASPLSRSLTHICTEAVPETRFTSLRPLARRTQQAYQRRLRSSTIPRKQTLAFTSITSSAAHHVCGTRSRTT